MINHEIKQRSHRQRQNRHSVRQKCKERTSIPQLDVQLVVVHQKHHALPANQNISSIHKDKK